MKDNPSLILGKNTTELWKDCALAFYRLDMNIWNYMQELPENEKLPFIEAFCALRIMAEKLNEEDTRISNNYSNVIQVEFRR